MKNKLKVPKNSDSKLLSNDVEATLIGVMILLVSLIGLLGKGPVGQFLQYCIVFIFGNFYFLVFSYLIVFSLYLIITKKAMVMKINMYLFSFILILFSFLIGASNTNVELTISNFTNTYMNVLNATPGISLFKIESFEAISYTGGGYLGYMLRGFLNTCFTSVGTTITIAIFAFVGISIFLKDFIVYFVKFFKKLKSLNQKKKEEKANKVSISSQPSELLKPIQEQSLEEKKEEVIPPQEKISKQEEKEEVLQKPIISPFVDDINEEENNKISPTKTQKVEIEPIITQKKEISPFEEIEEDKPKSVPYRSESIEIKPSYDLSKEENSNTNEITNRNIKENYVNDSFKQDNSFNSNLEISHEEKRPKYEQYTLPPLSLLSNEQNDDVSYENKIVAETRLNKINELFSQFKIGANAISYTIGPSCTRFNIKMNPGVKVNVLSSIQNEIAINLGGNKTVRLELVVEGRDTSSIEIGNVKIASVSYKECLQSISNRTSSKDKLLVPLGKGIEGNVVSVSLDDLPHLLIAGTTGSGKSVLVNTIITTLIMRNRPDELKLMLIDPKKIEFSKYNDLPHLLCPVITEALEGKNALKRLVEEMERRYSLFLTNGKGCSKISEYNELASSLHYDKLPNIVMICDEFSDFMSEYGKDIEPLIKRLAQKARACGIYLIICTQRPSVNVITGDIKAVVPSRIALLVPQVIDSRIILDEAGAESLLGNGDMLCRIPRHNSLVRVQGAYIKNIDIIRICDFIKGQAQVDYDDNFASLIENEDFGLASTSYEGINRREKDVLHELAKEHVIKTRIASTSNLQSKFGIGYARADHILNCLEDEHVIARSGNGNRRVVVMSIDEYENQKNQERKQDE
ncbi:MAG: DNA translocase FtsK [Bacilli bacterium]|nr:DNA translocase FtsK [Bacilli bacterium]